MTCWRARGTGCRYGVRYGPCSRGCRWYPHSRSWPSAADLLDRHLPRTLIKHPPFPARWREVGFGERLLSCWLYSALALLAGWVAWPRRVKPSMPEPSADSAGLLHRGEVGFGLPSKSET